MHMEIQFYKICIKDSGFEYSRGNLNNDESREQQPCY